MTLWWMVPREGTLALGLMQPLEGLVSMRSAQVLHLTHVNPHVTSVLDSLARFKGHRGKGAAAAEVEVANSRPQGHVHMGRQSSAAVLMPARGGVNCGVGSFAFQGTNGRGPGSGSVYHPSSIVCHVVFTR